MNELIYYISSIERILQQFIDAIPETSSIQATNARSLNVMCYLLTLGVVSVRGLLFVVFHVWSVNGLGSSDGHTT